MSHTTLTPHQEEIFENIVSDIIYNLTSPLRSNNIEDQMLSLTGAAGVGKSFLTAEITKSLSEKFRQYQIGVDGICVTAPTHKAVKVIQALIYNHNINTQCSTLHSFLHIQPYYDYETGEEKFTVIRTKNPPRASLLIVDESSMVSTALFQFIKEAISRGQVNTVLFIGDSNQLLPVNNGESKVFSLQKQYQLTEIVRQAKESNIIKLATKIRECISTQEFISLKDILSGSEADDIEFFEDKEKFINDYCKNDDWAIEDKIITAYTNNDVEIFNKTIRDRYWKEKGTNNPPLFLHNDKIRFKNPYITYPREHLNTILFQNSEEIVIDTAELIEGFNIKYWRCTAVGRNPNDIFRVIDPDSEVTLNNALETRIQLAKMSEREYKAQYWHDYYRLKNYFADVQYIFGSTIHKLQGSTVDTIYIDFSTLINNEKISNDLKYRLAYVAITRARHKVKILF
jgi:ATP-dependent exoDNAse (exonuclease V) alpha subunit